MNRQRGRMVDYRATMRAWKITGADRDTGEDKTVRIEARTQDEAIQHARELGIVVSNIVENKAENQPAGGIIVFDTLLAVVGYVLLFGGVFFMFTEGDKTTQALIALLGGLLIIAARLGDIIGLLKRRST